MDLQLVLYTLKKILKFIVRYASTTPEINGLLYICITGLILQVRQMHKTAGKLWHFQTELLALQVGCCKLAMFRLTVETELEFHIYLNI